MAADETSDDSDPPIALDASAWADAKSDADARLERASSVRWTAWMTVIAVSLVAMVGTFFGLPLVAAFTVLTVMAIGAGLVVSVGLSRFLPAQAGGLDAIRGAVSREWNVALTRDEVARLARYDATIAALSRITAAPGDGGVTLHREEIEPDPGNIWTTGTIGGPP